MTTPIIESIALNILDTVQSVTVGNGYNFTLTAQRHAKTGDVRAHLNAIIVQGDPTRVLPSNPNIYEWNQPFEIGVFVIPLDTDTVAIDTYVNQIRSDVEEALTEDIYRGNLALDTRILAPRLTVEEGGHDVVVIQAEVNYRTVWNNPYAKG